MLACPCSLRANSGQHARTLALSPFSLLPIYSQVSTQQVCLSDLTAAEAFPSLTRVAAAMAAPRNQAKPTASAGRALDNGSKSSIAVPIASKGPSKASSGLPSPGIALTGEEDPMKSANPLRASAATSTHRPKMHKRSGACAGARMSRLQTAELDLFPRPRSYRYDRWTQRVAQGDLPRGI